MSARGVGKMAEISSDRWARPSVFLSIHFVLNVTVMDEDIVRCVQVRRCGGLQLRFNVDNESKSMIMDFTPNAGENIHVHVNPGQPPLLYSLHNRLPFHMT